MPVDELSDERPERRGVLVERGDGPLAGRLSRTLVRLFVRDEVGRRQEPVLEIVDAEVRRFGVRHGTQMSGDLEAALMSLVDRGAELGARDLHVRLERRRAHCRPIRHLPSRVGRVFERMHLERAARAVQVRRRGVDRRARAQAGIDLALQVQVHHPVRVPAGPHRRDAAGEIQAREALAELTVDGGAGRVVEVLVHHHEAGHDGLAREIDDGCAVRHGDADADRRRRERIADR